MHNVSMPIRAIASLVLVLFAFPVVADDLLGPAEYLKIVSDSKLRYLFQTTPAKTPAAGMQCERRDERTRVVVRDGEKTLVEWTIHPEAKKLLNEGETLYQAEKLDEAAEKYKAALAVDPQAVSGYYFYGDTLLFGKNDNAGALEQYRKGIALDPTMPSGHFFASTALVRLGRADEAREEIIQALTYHPSYDAIWRIADASVSRWNARPIVRHRFQPPAGFLGIKTEEGIEIYIGPNGEWAGYALCKAAWANEPQFEKSRGGTGGWSLEEERACVLSQVMAAYNTAEANLTEERKQAGKEGETPGEEILAAMPELERYLFEVGKAKLLDGYVLFEIIGQQCPMAMSMLPDEAKQQLDSYIRKYVIVAK